MFLPVSGELFQHWALPAEESLAAQQVDQQAVGRDTPELDERGGQVSGADGIMTA